MRRTGSITGVLSVLMATLGFSYALATSNADSRHKSDSGSNPPLMCTFVKPGSCMPLSFANPLVSGFRDLGDAVVGSALTRIVVAKGGLPPYRFTAPPPADLKGLKLATNGVVTGKLGAGTNASFNFNVNVTDSFLNPGNSATDSFRVNVVQTNQFRFAQNKLSDAVIFRSYADTLSTINGALPITFS